MERTIAQKDPPGYTFNGMENCFRLEGGTLFLDIKAQPGASKSCLAGTVNGRLKVRIAKAPEDGKANAELAALLSGLLGCPKREVRLVTGERSRLKTLALPASCLEKLKELLAAIPGRDQGESTGD